MDYYRLIERKPPRDEQTQQLECEGVDWGYIVFGTALLVVLILATVPVRAWASLGWGP